MKKYSPAPKEIADSIRNAVPVSEKEALGDDWKKLPAGGTRSKGRNKLLPGMGDRITVSKQKIFHTPARKGKEGFFQRVKIGDVCLEVPGSAGEAYTNGLINLLKAYLKKHPVKA